LVYAALFGGFYLVLAAPQLGSTKDPSRRPRHRHSTRGIPKLKKLAMNYIQASTLNEEAQGCVHILEV
jgi:hypothetical protein